MIDLKLVAMGGFDQLGFRKMQLQLRNNGKVVDAMNVISGGPGRQKESFVHPSQDYSGSMRCIPEGIYSIAPLITQTWYEAGIGYRKVPLYVQAEFRANNRGGFLIHDDANRATARGSAGCITTHTSADFDYILAWLKQSARPVRLVVDYGLGFLAQRGFAEEQPSAPQGSPRTISQLGIDLVKHFEGLHKLRPDGMVESYPDVAWGWKVATVGYGSTKGITQGMVISPAQAEALLKKDMTESEAEVRRCVKVPLTQGEFDALCSFQFNTGALAASTLCRLLNVNNRASAAEEFLRWNKANNQVLEGLTRRRKAERHMFLSGELKTQF